MPFKLVHRLALATALLAAPAANAQALLGPMFQDHAVLQRDKPIAVSGQAKPGAEVHVAIAGSSAAAKADKAGNWHAQLAALPAGGPYDLTASSGGAAQTVHDVLLGDVWLCSGQSNMEFKVSQTLDAQAEIAAANDPQTRLMIVARDSNAAPRTDFKTPVSWQPVTPQTIGEFSAACWFMARDLRATQKVPFGLIDATWGGTAVNAWRSEPSLNADPRAKDGMALLHLYRTDPAKAALQFGEPWTAWWRAQSHDAPGSEPWQAGAPGDWKPVPSFDFWENWGVPQLAAYNGMLWYRTEITLTAKQAKQAATLSLGTVDDADMTFVNGTVAGTTNMWDTLRSYALKPGMLHAGVNRITVGALDTYGNGGMHSSADQRTLRFADGSVVPLPDPGRWQYRVTPGMYGAPHAPWETIVGLGSIYNGMIAPIGLYTLRGVAWYQGEADGEFPAGYAGRLSSMMAGWRAQFGDPALPFLIVQLPNWGPRNAVPIESGFASVRDEQRRAVLADPHAALAVTIDLGDVVNLHPLNKQDVGHRLSRAATALVYGGAMPSNGPLGVRAKHVAGGFGIAFQGVDQAMAAYNGAPLGFELCGSAAGTCRFAPARFAGGSHVVVADDGQPATRIRYCWGESPVCNLSDASGIPAAPFELAIQ